LKGRIKKKNHGLRRGGWGYGGGPQLSHFKRNGCVLKKSGKALPVSEGQRWGTFWEKCKDVLWHLGDLFNEKLKGRPAGLYRQRGLMQGGRETRRRRIPSPQKWAASFQEGANQDGASGRKY